MNCCYNMSIWEYRFGNYKSKLRDEIECKSFLQGYISILPSVVDFLFARWYASDHSILRLKDKYYLFLSENENPTYVLGQEILKRKFTIHLNFLIIFMGFYCLGCCFTFFCMRLDNIDYPPSCWRYINQQFSIFEGSRTAIS